jgi:glutamate-1-semialdehyde 2,1-aminomutase
MSVRPSAEASPCYLPSVIRRVTDRDAELFRRELAGFVPPDSFDVHAHLYTVSGLNVTHELSNEDAAAELGVEAYRKSVRSWMGDACPRDGLFFGLPISATADVVGENRFVGEQVARHESSRALRLVRPTDDPAAVGAALQTGHFCGFKVYHTFAASASLPETPASIIANFQKSAIMLAEGTYGAAIEAFLPEWVWELADRHELAIMLHLVRQQALSDPGNLEYVREHCLRYPNARLVLAHAARGFCAQHTVGAIDLLRGLGNVFFDTAAICEPAAFEAILRAFGPSRLLFGTDWPICNLRGRCVSVADGFFWMYDHNVDWETSQFSQPTLVGIESLLALKQAARTCALTDGDLERIFRTNARQLLGIRASGQEDCRVGQVCNPPLRMEPGRPNWLGPATPAAPNEFGRPPTAPSFDVVCGGGRTQALYEAAKKLIPGGTQLLSKRPEQLAPGKWPAYFAEARGCEVIDLDGRRFVDMAYMGIGACLLGYNDPDVTAAVVRRVQLGSMSTLNSPEEAELAELLVALHPWADQVRYFRCGGEAMAAAVRIARASTGRDKVALCGYHGWHDWYLATNLPTDATGAGKDRLREHLLPGLEPAGVPSGLAGTVFPFRFNQLEELRAIVEGHGPQLAAIVMEPTRGAHPEPGFLEGVRDLCSRCGAKLVIDEITIGFRLCLGGAHLKYGLAPDLAVYAKALGNGHPMAAVVGTADTMDACQRTFISSTYWTESVGPTAALATLRKMQQVDVPAHVARIGGRMRAGWEDLARRHGVPMHTAGHDCLVKLGFDHPDDLALQTLLTVRMLEREILACAGFYPSLAHEERHVDAYLAAAGPVFAELGEAARAGDAASRVGGAVRQSGFARLA